MAQSSNPLTPSRSNASSYLSGYADASPVRPPVLTAQGREDVERLRAKVRAHNPGYIYSNGVSLPSQIPSVPELLDELARNVAGAKSNQDVPATPLPEVEQSELAKAGFDWRAIADRAITALENGSHRPLPLANDPEAANIPGLSVIAAVGAASVSSPEEPEEAAPQEVAQTVAEPEVADYEAADTEVADYEAAEPEPVVQPEPQMEAQPVLEPELQPQFMPEPQPEELPEALPEVLPESQPEAEQAATVQNVYETAASEQSGEYFAQPVDESAVEMMEPAQVEPENLAQMFADETEQPLEESGEASPFAFVEGETDEVETGEEPVVADTLTETAVLASAEEEAATGTLPQDDLMADRVYDDDVLEPEGNDDELFVGDIEGRPETWQPVENDEAETVADDSVENFGIGFAQEVPPVPPAPPAPEEENLPEEISEELPGEETPLPTEFPVSQLPEDNEPFAEPDTPEEEPPIVEVLSLDEGDEETASYAEPQDFGQTDLNDAQPGEPGLDDFDLADLELEALEEEIPEEVLPEVQDETEEVLPEEEEPGDDFEDTEAAQSFAEELSEQPPVEDYSDNFAQGEDVLSEGGFVEEALAAEEIPAEGELDETELAVDLAEELPAGEESEELSLSEELPVEPEVGQEFVQPELAEELPDEPQIAQADTFAELQDTLPEELEQMETTLPGSEAIGVEPAEEEIEDIPVETSEELDGIDFGEFDVELEEELAQDSLGDEMLEEELPTDNGAEIGETQPEDEGFYTSEEPEELPFEIPQVQGDIPEAMQEGFPEWNPISQMEESEVGGADEALFATEDYAVPEVETYEKPAKKGFFKKLFGR